MARRRGLRMWEIALFVWSWQSASLAIAAGAGALVQAVSNHGLFTFAFFLMLDPLRSLEQRSWQQVKASRQ